MSRPMSWPVKCLTLCRDQLNDSRYPVASQMSRAMRWRQSNFSRYAMASQMQSYVDDRFTLSYNLLYIECIDLIRYQFI